MKTHDLEKVLDGMQRPQVVVAGSGEILFANRAACDALALGDAVGVALDEVLDQDRGAGWRPVPGADVDWAGTCARCVALETDELELWRKMQTILDNLPGIAYRCANEPDWPMEYVSQGCRDLTGYDGDELVGNRVIAFGELIHPEDAADVWEKVQAALEERRPFQLEYRIRTRTGEEKWVWEQGVGVYGGDEFRAIEGIITDATERRRAEEERRSMERQMRAAQRMEAVGRLAGGIAHDFNNVLTIITAQAVFLEPFVEGEEKGRKCVNTLLDAVDRAARLTHQLLAFSRKQVRDEQVLDVNEVVRAIQEMTANIMPATIEIRRQLDDTEPRIRADVGQLEQVLMNLIVNARDAMPDGGLLTISTSTAVFEEAVISSRGGEVEPGSYAVLAVSDTGEGMDPETRAKIFDPFFTTKDVGQGTGLGLSTVHGIVEQSGGWVWVRSEPGQGSTFRIYLPLVADDVLVAELVSTHDPAELRGDELVLLVEDDDALLEATTRVLSTSGYRVVGASNGRSALEQLEEYEVDAVVTDVIMPEMTGAELVADLRRRGVTPAVVFTSGYTGETLSSRSLTEDGASFLAKPFTPTALLARLRNALDAMARKRVEPDGT